jgi:hypothetical protein
MHNQRFCQAHHRDMLKRIQHNLVCVFRSYIIFSTLFRSSTYFLGIYLFNFGILEKEKHFWLVGWLPARGLQLYWASGLLRRPGWLGGPKANSLGGPATGRVGVRRAHRCVITTGAAGGGSSVAYVGGGGWHEQEGTTEHAPCKERGDGAHRGGRAVTALWVSGGDDAFRRPPVTGSWGLERDGAR